MNRRSFLSTSLVAAASPLVVPGLVRSAQAASAAGPDPVSTNKVIADARAAGLALLKPSPKDLERGMALHASSVVLDVYGFGPGASVDNAILAKIIESGASELEIAEAREDMNMTRFITDPAERVEYEGAWQAAGVTAIIRNSGEEGNDAMRLMKRLARWVQVTDRMRERFPKAVRADEIVAAKKAGHQAIMMTTNGVPLVQQWINTVDELRHIRTFAELGVRMMHLTYNRRNLLGDGCAEPANGGLSDLGRAAIAEMNRVGVIVDVAHCGWRTSLEAAQASRTPMVASHTVCAGLRNHIRAKPDEVIRAICDTGGLVGICWIPAFLGGKGGIRELLDHVDYAVGRFGADHVAIGTDVSHASQHASAPAEQSGRRAPGRARPAYEALWPDGALGGDWPDADSLAWTNWPLVTVGLAQRGHSDDTIRKILGGNMLRVCRDVLPDHLASR